MVIVVMIMSMVTVVCGDDGDNVLDLIICLGLVLTQAWNILWLDRCILGL